jgi:hypothetical protein
MALELAKANLWLEAHVSDKPLTFLDHHLRCGDSLLGATPALIEAGIPDAAFKVIEGDDRTACAGARKHNRELRDWQQGLLFAGEADAVIPYDKLAARSASLTAMEDGDIAALHAKEAAFAAWQGSPEQPRLDDRRRVLRRVYRPQGRRPDGPVRDLLRPT